MMDRGGAEVLALGWRGGLYQYHSVFIVRRDSGLDSLNSLRGHSVGFQHPMSTSAYLVPAGMLLAEQLPVAILLSPRWTSLRASLSDTRFTGTEANSVAWVEKRIVDAAAISNQDWDDLVCALTPSMRRVFRSLHKVRTIREHWNWFALTFLPRSAIACVTFCMPRLTTRKRHQRWPTISAPNVSANRTRPPWPSSRFCASWRPGFDRELE